MIGDGRMIEAYATGYPVRIVTYGQTSSPPGDQVVVGVTPPRSEFQETLTRKMSLTCPSGHVDENAPVRARAPRWRNPSRNVNASWEQVCDIPRAGAATPAAATTRAEYASCRQRLLREAPAA